VDKRNPGVKHNVICSDSANIVNFNTSINKLALIFADCLDHKISFID